MEHPANGLLTVEEKHPKNHKKHKKHKMYPSNEHQSVESEPLEQKKLGSKAHESELARLQAELVKR